MAARPTSAIPDVLAPGLRCVFCGINPGRVSDAAKAHFANPRNDFWRLLHEGGFTPRRFDPQEQLDLLPLGWGVTNAASRTTPGSSDLRRGDFDLDRIEAIAAELEPVVIAFVGKEAYRGLFNERPELGPQLRTLGSAALYVLPSTSPANAAVPYAERLRAFRGLRAWLEPEPREAVRAVLVDRDDRLMLVQYENPVTRARWWGTPGGGIEAGETDEEALRRELREELGLEELDLGRRLWEHERVFPWDRRLFRQRSTVYLVRVEDHEPRVALEDGVVAARWWPAAELASTAERITPPDLAERVRVILADDR